MIGSSKRKNGMGLRKLQEQSETGLETLPLQSKGAVRDVTIGTHSDPPEALWPS